MIEIQRTSTFTQWLNSLRDEQTRTRIATRIFRLGLGNPGQARSVGDGIMELKLDFGPGYRVYYIQRGNIVIVLLCGGDKATQSKDIERAKALAVLLDKE